MKNPSHKMKKLARISVSTSACPDLCVLEPYPENDTATGSSAATAAATATTVPVSIRQAPCLSCAFSFFKPEPSSFLTLIHVVSSSRNRAIPFRISKATVLLWRSIQTRVALEDLTTFDLASSKRKRSTRINPLSHVPLPLYFQSVMEDCCLGPCSRIVHEDSASINPLS